MVRMLGGTPAWPGPHLGDPLLHLLHLLALLLPFLHQVHGAARLTRGALVLSHGGGGGGNSGGNSGSGRGGGKVSNGNTKPVTAAAAVSAAAPTQSVQSAEARAVTSATREGAAPRPVT